MAIQYKNFLTGNVGASLASVYNPTSSGIQSTVIGMTLSNTTASSITANVLLTSGGTTVYIIKNAVIPTGNSFDVVGAGKFIVEQNDNLQVQSNTASSIDVLVSTIEVS